MDKNEVYITGVLVGAPRFVSDRYGERMYELEMIATRNSGAEDAVLLHVGEYKLGNRVAGMVPGAVVRVLGEIRWYKEDETRNRLGVHVHDMSLENVELGNNLVRLTGALCKEPIFRWTPNGRAVCELMVKAVRKGGRYTKVPVIAWGECAKWAKGLERGQRVELQGRMQSRDYDKEQEDGTVKVLRTTEVSAAWVREEMGEM